MSQEKWAWTEASSLRFQYHNTIPKKGTKIGNCLLEKNRTRGLSTPQRVLSTKVLLPPQPSSSALLLSPPPQPSTSALLLSPPPQPFSSSTSDAYCLRDETPTVYYPRTRWQNPIAYPRRCCQSQYPVTARWGECYCREHTQAPGWLLWYRVFRTTSFRSLECDRLNETIQESNLNSLPAICAALSNFNKLSEIQVSHLKKNKEHLNVFHWVIVKVKGMK